MKTCDALKHAGRMEYETLVEGDLTEKHEAVVPADIVSEKNKQLEII